MNKLEMIDIGQVPALSGKAILNGEDVSTDTFKVEIGISQILLYRYATPRLSEEGKLVEIVTVIDELKVN